MFPVLRPSSDQRRDERSSKIGDTGGGGTYDCDVAVSLELWDPGVIFLEDTEGEWEAPEESFEDECCDQEAPGCLATVGGGEV